MKLNANCAPTSLLKQCAHMFFWVAVTALVSSCGDVSLEWREEVRLKDGSIILVHRTVEGTKLGEIGGPGGWESKAMTVEVLK